MSKALEAYKAAAIRLGCRLCERESGQSMADVPCCLHHPRTGVGAARKAPDSEVIPICPRHHQNGPHALHVMGRKAFEAHWGVTEVELTAETKRLVKEHYGLEPPPVKLSKIMRRSYEHV